MSTYAVQMTSGAIIPMPRDAARSQYEYISDYGLQAVLERIKRTPRYRAALRVDPDDRVAAIITPHDYVTQF